MNLKRLEKAQERNFKERLNFIDFWVGWMKKHPKTWSKEQKRLIDAVMP